MRHTFQTYALLLGVTQAILAQTPLVTEVVNAATGQPHLSPGAIVVVRGKDLCRPCDVFTGQSQLLVSGRSGHLLAFDEEGSGLQATFQLPVEVDPGPAALSVSTPAGKSPDFKIQLDAYAPGIFPASDFLFPETFRDPHVVCYSRGVSAGSVVTVYATGLGPTVPSVPTGTLPPPSTLASTVAKPRVVIEGVDAEVVESVLDPAQVGQYRIRFRLPPGIGIRTTSLQIGGFGSPNLLLLASAPGAIPTFSAATWMAGPGAPDSMMIAYACSGTLTDVSPGVLADPASPPVSLGATTVTVKDSAGVERPAPILFAAPPQVNYIIPSGAADGPAIVTIASGGNRLFTAGVEIRRVAPGLFDSWLLTRVRGGAVSYEPVRPIVQIAQGTSVGPLTPIDLGPETDQVYLLLFGTGLRGRSSISQVNVTIGGIPIPVEYVGAQNQYAGLDQVNLRLPRSLRGLGEVPLEVTADGQRANLGKIAVQ